MRDRTFIPINPQTTYKKYWKGWGDFLGTQNESLINKKFLPYNEARKYVLKFKLKSVNEWKVFIKTNTLLKGIPRLPNLVYQKSGWKSWGDFLGTNTTAPQNIIYRPLNKARAYVRSLNLKSRNEWDSFLKSGSKPKDIPSAPHMCKQYKKEGWINWGDFLGTGNVASFNRTYKQFKDARKYVRALKLKSFADWRKFCKSGGKPSDLPYHPERTYKKEWKGFEDFIGINYNVDFLKYKEAKNYAKKLNLNSKGWRQFVASGKKPKEIPSNPDKTYKNKGWKSWSDFLGKS